MLHLVSNVLKGGLSFPRVNDFGGRLRSAQCRSTPRRTVTYTAVLSALLVAGCSAVSNISRGHKLDAGLGSAGFEPVAESELRGGQLATVALANLEPLTFYPVRGAGDGRLVYVVADPYDCGCVFIGSSSAYQRYQAVNAQTRQVESKVAVTHDPKLEQSLAYALTLSRSD